MFVSPTGQGVKAFVPLRHRAKVLQMESAGPWTMCTVCTTPTTSNREKEWIRREKTSYAPVSYAMIRERWSELQMASNKLQITNYKLNIQWNQYLHYISWPKPSGMREQTSLPVIKSIYNLPFCHRHGLRRGRPSGFSRLVQPFIKVWPAGSRKTIQQRAENRTQRRTYRHSLPPGRVVRRKNSSRNSIRRWYTWYTRFTLIFRFTHTRT